MGSYDFKTIESKWQGIWEQQKLGVVNNNSGKKKPYYALVEFPYPSGDGLHVGHMRAFCGLEVLTRMRRLQGYDVLFPIGWDAFGLPTENYAIKTGKHPRSVTDKNIANFKRQIKVAGFCFDWSREIDTTAPDYYKWTQWIFIKMFERGLAYKSTTLVNYCENCKVVLANEDCQGGKCDRCGRYTTQKEKSVWFLKIREYADKLLEGLNCVDFNDRIKQEQRNWIGKSEGLQLDFTVQDCKLPIFTTRPETIFGVSFCVIAPEHPLIKKLSDKIKNIVQVEKYILECKQKTEFERVSKSQKTGVLLQGVFAFNPISKKNIPIFVADYCLYSFGTGAVMGVPAHDSRDCQFAKIYNLPVIKVIEGDLDECYDVDNCSKLINSGFLDGLDIQKAKEKITQYCIENELGITKIDYKMKDWAFNRQRYWGEPIPIVECNQCGFVALPESQLPLILPEMKKFEPGIDGQSPLSRLDDWVNTTCPKCGRCAKRETDTMPQWAGSSWYFLRFMSPKSGDSIVDSSAYSKWGQVDWYNGGMEHTTRHLIYSRFYNHFLFDIGIVKHKEPYAKRTSQGLILGQDGEKMSKSRGNVVSPDAIVEQYGADVLRLYVMFIGDYEKPVPWSNSSIAGCQRFLNRVWGLKERLGKGSVYINEIIVKVTKDIESLKYNTAISSLMTLCNESYNKGISKTQYADMLKLIYPFAPHMTEELWQICEFDGFLNQSTWPKPNHKENEIILIQMPIQINGKFKGTVQVLRGSTQQQVKSAVFDTALKTQLHSIKKEVFVMDKIYNFIV
ncbi:MAG: leucine--tRNA ligase [Clostridiales bacterium]|jgi:leucyl-tRNA synthetase|nr:leucine--tRNA ligase [Clostridiales bacterium]